MRRLLVLSLLLAAGAREAKANSCNYHLVYGTTMDLPLGCPLIAYAHDASWPFTPILTGKRNLLSYDATGPHETSSTQLPVWFETIDDQCVEHDYFADEPYERISIEVQNAVVGDVVYLGSPTVNAYIGVTMVEAGPCPANDVPLQYLYCQDGIQDYWSCYEDDSPDDPPAEDPADPPEPQDAHDHDHVGCNAGSGFGLGASVLLLGLFMRRRSRLR
jgi:hypothetical protein